MILWFHLSDAMAEFMDNFFAYKQLWGTKRVIPHYWRFIAPSGAGIFIAPAAGQGQELDRKGGGNRNFKGLKGGLRGNHTLGIFD